MKIIKYFFESILIVTFFFIFKIIGYKNASNLGEYLGRKVGPFFRSRSKIQKNLKDSNFGETEKERDAIIQNMGELWKNIIRVYLLKQFRKKQIR